MHGMICRSLESFVATTRGAEVWDRVRQQARLPFDRFETMLTYRDADFVAVQHAAAEVLDRPVLTIMEDMGTWICTHPPLEPVRRLFRFTGATFQDLLLSLDEIDARARLAVPDLHLPALDLEELGEGEYLASSTWVVPGACAVLTGILRVLADEYGALATIETTASSLSGNLWQETISIRLVDEAFHTPKAFQLGAEA